MSSQDIGSGYVLGLFAPVRYLVESCNPHRIGTYA